ncbi:CPBP family intramembrane glutamic endopeptidase [Gilvimarinus chinensis]|uniref:CPBP family intramembrane glutamic endopeptidase n=1 Tax=Gilvimarinus chinensis TaxID=396005 RepID=UPI0003A89605|nr:CPBP family intramembrane glutamic endopeptidase [Gilvimarinus chinensis]
MPRIVTQPTPLCFSVATSGVILLAATISWAAGALPTVCLIGLALLPPALYGLQHLTGLAAAGLWLFSLGLSFFIATYRPENFHYPLIHHFTELKFELHLNLAKVLTGYLLLAWLWQQGSSKRLELCLPLSLASSTAIIVTAWWLFNYQWDPKWPNGIWWFLAINLGATVIAEEAFFRLGLQKSVLQMTGSSPFAVIFSAAVFVLAHAPKDVASALLFSLAGLTYGLVYNYTGRFSAAVLTHFTVNALHFSLLSYP